MILDLLLIYKKMEMLDLEQLEELVVKVIVAELVVMKIIRFLVIPTDLLAVVIVLMLPV